MVAGSEAVSTTDWGAVKAPPAGLAVTVGATVSMTNALLTVVTLPAASVPCTLKV